MRDQNWSIGSWGSSAADNRETGDVSTFVLVENFEVLLFQVTDSMALGVANDDRNQHRIHSDSDFRLGILGCGWWLLLTRDRRYGRQSERQNGSDLKGHFAAAASCDEADLRHVCARILAAQVTYRVDLSASTRV